MLIKSDMRVAAKQLRARCHAETVADTGYRLSGHFAAGPLATWDHEKRPVIAGYWPFGTEIDVKPLLGMLTAYGFTVALPVCERAEPVLAFRQWRPEMILKSDALGMLVPPEDVPFVDPDIVIAPALAFDAKGYRLGYGGGYYDATLHVLRAGRPIVAVAVAYAACEVQELPIEPQDERVDWIVTENGSRYIGA